MQKQRKHRLNWNMIFLVFAIACLIASLLFYVKSQTPNSGPYYLTVPSPVADYVVAQFANGSYYNVNGTNWNVDLLSANEATVLQGCIDALPSGGTIYLFEVALPSVTYGSNILIVQDLLGTRSYYSNNALVSSTSSLGISISNVYGASWMNSTNVNANLWYANGQNRTDAVANPTGTASYIIDVSGSTYRMKNGTTGQIDFQSTNASAVIDNALNNLTANRYWQERVVALGNFTITNTVQVPSWTILDIYGAWIMANGANCNMINNTHYTLGDERITIRYGTLIGNSGGQSLGNGIYLSDNNAQWKGTRSSDPCNSLEGLTLYDFKQAGIYIDNSLRATQILDCSIKACGGYGLHLKGKDAYVAKLITASNHVNIYIDGQYNVLYRCSSIRAAAYGIEIAGSSGYSNVLYYPIAEFGSTYGIAVYQSCNNRIFSPTVITNGNSGIVLYQATYNLIEGGLIFDTASSQNYGIEEQSTADYNTFELNDVRNNTVAGMSIIGAHTKLRGNVGFVTENSGSTASCVNGTWIAHGLAGQPNGACELKVNGTRLINATCYVMDPVIIAQNSTHVQIEFLCNNAGTFVAVGMTETKTILWSFEYIP